MADKAAEQAKKLDHEEPAYRVQDIGVQFEKVRGLTAQEKGSSRIGSRGVFHVTLILAGR